MIKSMTGYGRNQEFINGMNITVELKSVNHRYFEFSCRTPRAYGFLDDKLKGLVQGAISRGKVECCVLIDCVDTDDVSVSVNHSLAGGYVGALAEIAERYGLENDVKVSTLARYNDIFSTHRQPADEDSVWQAVKTVATGAVERFIEMRSVEGEKLKNDVLARAQTILTHVEFVESRSPQTVAEYSAKLAERIKALLEDAQIDEKRLLTEAAIYADKTAVDEETVRLRSHICQLGQFMESEEPIGRKVDFLVQEMNREANTIGSKAQDVEIAKRVLEIKAEVEKIREQIQNIE